MKALVLALMMVFGTGFAISQKYAYIDSDYILSNMPEYTEAKEKLDKLADRWTKEIEKRYEVLTMKKDNFAREEVLLPAEEKKKRQEEIEKLETEAIKPIQDRVYDAMQKVASKRNYSFVFDKANQSNLVYADSKYDISNSVLKEMGVTVR
jgi:outer membrane protein